MTQEEKDLLLKDLCARLSYGVKAKANDITVVTINGIVKLQSLTGYFYYDIITDNGNFYLKEVKPYLRSMLSMTEEEIYDLAAIMTQGLPHDIDVEQGYFKVTCKELIDGLDHDIEYEFYVQDVVDGIFGIKGYDWLNAHHFDYRGLIDEGLAIEVTEENNPY